MAGESCNLDEEEAEILKPSSPSSSSPTPPSRPAASLPSLFPKPPHEPPTQRSGRLETPASDPHTAAACGPDEKSPARGRETESPARFANRCSSCRRRVGLTAFRCRCGDLFCARHRYSDAHDCAFDYKAAGRDEICRANPVIKAAKIIKI